MMTDKSCPFCGVSAWSQKEGVVVYGCSTSIDPHQVLRSATCVARERDILRQRIDTALKALTGNNPTNLEGS